MSVKRPAVPSMGGEQCPDSTGLTGFQVLTWIQRDASEPYLDRAGTGTLVSHSLDFPRSVPIESSGTVLPSIARISLTSSPLSGRTSGERAAGGLKNDGRLFASLKDDMSATDQQRIDTADKI